MATGPSRLREFWLREEQQPFTGWDFSYLDHRMVEDRPPWSYSSRATELMHGASSVVDLGTGGGERLLRLQEHWPRKVVAAEDYPPNFRLASERLAPFGVKVVSVRLTADGPMPFDDGEFDLVLNRHAAFNPAEVARILAAGGTFLTQQVHRCRHRESTGTRSPAFSMALARADSCWFILGSTSGIASNRVPAPGPTSPRCCLRGMTSGRVSGRSSLRVGRTRSD